MKLGKKLGLGVFLLAGIMALGYLPSATQAAKADGIQKVTVKGTEYTLNDSYSTIDLSSEGAVTSKWGRQAATVTYENGVNYCAAQQPINTTITAGSYHTKFDLTLVTPDASWFNMMLRQNSGVTYAAADGTIDVGLRNGFELFTQNQGFQLLHNNNNERTMLAWFAYDEAGCWSVANRVYTLEIWVLNLSDGSVQFIIDVNGVNKYNGNTNDIAEAAGKTWPADGQIRFNGQFAVDTTQSELSTMAFNVKGHSFKHGDYALDDAIEEVDLSVEGSLTSKWGRQAATVQYVKGVHECAAYQPINSPINARSYHTKFDLTMVTADANYFNMMLRQNSGDTTTCADGTVDVGLRNGFEIFTGDNGFQAFYNENNVRTALGWFAYDEAGCWSKANRTYTFEIWVLNLLSGDVAIIIDINGENKFNVNTANVTALAGKKLVKEGQIRFSGQFAAGTEQQDLSSMAINVKGYSQTPVAKKTYQLADDLTEWDFSADNMLLSKWGNQAATVVYEDGAYTSQPDQPVNGTTTMGSYHAKFDLSFRDSSTSGTLAAWNWMLRQESGTRYEVPGTGKEIDVGTRTGYELFASNHYFQFFYNSNNNRTSLGGFLFADSDPLNDPTKTLKFEVWVLNLVDDSVQIIIDVDGVNKFNYNSVSHPDVTPIKSGTVRFAGSFDDLLGKGFYIKSDTLNAEAVPYTIEGEIPTEVEVMQDVDLSECKVTSQYDNFNVVGSLVGLCNTRNVGEAPLYLNVPGVETRTVNVKATSGSVVWSLKEGYTNVYHVGDKLINDFVLLRTEGEDVVEYDVLDSEISGFDSAANGAKTMTIGVAGNTFEVGYKVYEYGFSEMSKGMYEKDSYYEDGDIILTETCGTEVIETPILASDITQMDTSVLGIIEVKFEKFGKEFVTYVFCASYSIKEGYKDVYYVGEEYNNDIVLVVDLGTELGKQEVPVPVEALIGFDTSKAGMVVVTIQGLPETVFVTLGVLDVEMVSIEVSGAKTEFNVKDTFTTEGLKVIAKYNNGTTKDITKEAVIDSSAVDMASEGKYTIKVSYGGFEASYEITVKAASEPAKKGCGGSILAASGAMTLLAAAGICLLSLKKRKED